MGKAVATVGAVVTAVALIATGVGAAAGAGLLGATAAAAASSAGALTLFGVSVSEIALIGTGLSVVGGLLQGKPKVGGDYGTQVDWKADPTAGVPYIVGRTGVAGNIVLKDVAGDKNKYLFVTSVLSTGPVQSVSGYMADSVLVNFTGDSGEGASGGQLTTSLAQAAAAGATVIVVGSTQGFSAGQVITVGGESVTIKTVYSVGSQLQLTGALRAGHDANASVIGPTSTSFYKNRMWRKVSLGPPSAPRLTFTATGSKDTPANHSGVPGSWGASAKLSGLAHTIQAFEYDTAIYTTGEPKPLQVVEGVLCYDPRLDSTYPGGAGGQRWSDPRDRTQQGRFDLYQTTWSYSANPYIHALNWLLGRWDRNRADPSAYYVRTLGVGAPMQAIDVAAFVEAANIADAHGWTIGNQFYSTDPKWDVLVSMLQAGSGRPLKLGAMVSCLVNAPKVSLDTLTGDDVVGEASIQATQAGRDRLNAIWPRYREEAQGWQIVPTDAPIIVPAYVTADGGQRTKEVEYTCAAGGPDHVATLARYDIENSREFGPITLKCKPRWMGYKPGDCITINEPEYGLNGQKCLILNRSQDPATMVVTLTLRSETDGKHPFALGQTANPPATPALTGVDPSVVSVPTSAEWMAMGGQQTGPQGQALPVILVTGACSDPTIGQIIIEYRLANGTVWADWATLKADATSCQITGLAPQTGYVVGISYRSIRGVVGDRLELTPTTTGGIATDWSSVTDPLELKPEDNATKGAHTGTNLYGSDGSVLGDGDVITSEGTSASTTSVPGLATFGDQQKLVRDFLADYDAQVAHVLDLSHQVTDANGTIQTALSDAKAARDAANGAAQNALAAANLASSKASDASGSASAAAGSAADASSSASGAAGSATSAQGYANTASTKSDSAAQSAQAAATSAMGAAASRDAASSSASSASQSANNANTAFGNAQNSANSAAQSAQSAASSSSQAGGYASSAQQSATSANTSAGSANTSAGQASQSRTDAQGFATSASGFASQANAYANDPNTGAKAFAASAQQSSQAAANSAQAAASSASSIRASATGNPNLLTNGDFGQGSTGWAIYNGYIGSSDQGPWVGYNPGSGNLGFSERQVALQQVSNLSPGAAYSLSARMYTGFIGDSSTFARIVVQWLNSSGQEVRSDVAVQTNVKQGWTDYKTDANGGNLTAPGGAVKANIYLDIASSNGACTGTGDNFAVTRVKFEVGSACTGYSNERISAAVQTVQIAVASVQGYAAAYYGVQLDANGAVAGFSLLASGGGGYVPQSSFVVNANNFIVRGANGAVLSFSDTGGGTLSVKNLIIQTANIGTAAVGTLKIAGGSVTGLGYANGIANSQIANSAPGAAPPATPPATGGGSTGVTPPRGGGQTP